MVLLNFGRNGEMLMTETLLNDIKTFMDRVNSAINADITVSYYDGKSGICESEETLTFKTSERFEIITVSDFVSIYGCSEFFRILDDLNIYYRNEYQYVRSTYHLFIRDNKAVKNHLKSIGELV